jgi:hypothetical protein
MPCIVSRVQSTLVTTRKSQKRFPCNPRISRFLGPWLMVLVVGMCDVGYGRNWALQVRAKTKERTKSLQRRGQARRHWMSCSHCTFCSRNSVTKRSLLLGATEHSATGIDDFVARAVGHERRSIRKLRTVFERALGVELRRLWARTCPSRVCIPPNCRTAERVVVVVRSVRQPRQESIFPPHAM